MASDLTVCIPVTDSTRYEFDCAPIWNFFSNLALNSGVTIKYNIAIKETKPRTINVNFTEYKNIITTNTTEKNKSIITDTDLLVIKSLIWSNSLTLAMILPTFLDSKYVKGSANKCLKSFAPNLASILLAVCTKIYFLEIFNRNSNIITAIKPKARISRVVSVL